VRINHLTGEAGVKPRQSIFIATPTYSGDLSCHYVSSLMKTVKHLQANEVDHEVYFSVNDSLVARARNDLVHNFLKSECTHILMIDADQGWDYDAPLKMLRMNRKFITGAVPGRQTLETYALTIETNDDMTPKVDDQGMIYCATNGVAFALIERCVFDEIKTVTLHEVCPYFQHRYFDNGDHYGEDMFFTKSWKDTGGDLWIYPDITFVHGPITANYHKFLINQPKPGVMLENTITNLKIEDFNSTMKALL